MTRRNDNGDKLENMAKNQKDKKPERKASPLSRQIRSLIIAICITAVLVALLLIVKFMPSSSGNTTSLDTSSSSVALTNVDEDNISSITITNSTGTYTISGSEGNWAVNTLQGYPINQDKVEKSVDDIRAITATSTVTPGTSGLSQFGLETPAATAAITLTNGSIVTVCLGSETPMQDGYYAMLKGGSDIYIINSTVAGEMKNPAQNFIDLTLTSLSSSQLNLLTNITFGGTARTAITMVSQWNSASSYSVSYDSGYNYVAPTFKITSPGSYTANAENINSLVTKLCSLSASDFVSSDVSAASLAGYGLTNPQYTLTYTYNGTPTTISFGNTFEKNSSDYVYVMVSGKNIIYDIAVASVSFYKWSMMDIGPGNLASSKDIDTVSNITVTSGSGTWSYDLSYSDSDNTLTITSNGAALDSGNFKNFYNQINNLVPEGMASKASSSSLECTVTITYSDSSKDIYQFYSLPDESNSGNVDQYRVLTSVNGSANYYIKRTQMENILQYCQDIINGTSVPDIS